MDEISASQAHHFEESRRRSELWITAFVVVVCVVMLVLQSIEGLGGGAAAADRALLAAVLAVYYGTGWIRARRRAPPQWEQWLRTTIEVSIPSLVIVQAAEVLPAHEALLDAPIVIACIAVCLSAARLRPLLGIYAGVLAAVEWSIVYALLLPLIELPLLALQPDRMVIRALLLFALGIYAWYLSRRDTTLSQKIATTALEKDRIRRAFGAYVAEPVVEKLLERNVLGLPAERRAITVMFIDIRDFTRFAAERTPGDVLDRLNVALEDFSVEIQRCGGIVNKFLGDGLMALFGAPLDDPEHSRQAVRAAVTIANRARELNENDRFPGLRIGIGINTGEVVVGDVGGRGHREYTAIGDVVNVAARVESATRELDAVVLVTEAVVQHMGPGFHAFQHRPVRLKGKPDPVALWEIDIGEPETQPVTPLRSQAGSLSTPT